MKLPTKTVVQSLLFPRKPLGNWTVAGAKAWAKKNGKRYGDVDVKPEYIHLRQREPEEFQDGSMRTITFGQGIKAVIGRPWVELIDNPHPRPKHNARVIVATINGDFALHRRKHKVFEGFGRLKALNKFDRVRAAKSLSQLVNAAVRKYRRVHKIPVRGKAFVLDDFVEAKGLLIDQFLNEWKIGQLDYTIPKSVWKKGRRY